MDDEEKETQETIPTSEPEVTPELEPESEPEVIPEPEALKEPAAREPTGMLDIFPVEDTSLSNLPIFPD